MVTMFGQQRPTTSKNMFWSSQKSVSVANSQRKWPMEVELDRRVIYEGDGEEEGDKSTGAGKAHTGNKIHNKIYIKPRNIKENIKQKKRRRSWAA